MRLRAWEPGTANPMRMPLRFACPECGIELDAGEAAFALRASAPKPIRICRVCDREYERRDGVWRFLTPERLAALEPFARQYRAVRDRDGHRRASAPEFYRMLPAVSPDDPHAAEWRIRRETYHHLLRHVLPSPTRQRRDGTCDGGPQPVRVLDLGAGTGWLSHRLALLGHGSVAVDISDDEADGLGACRHYFETPEAQGMGGAFVAVQADFDALPFVASQFDLVVFNGSLHYAADPAATLARAHRMLAPGGSLVVMDSPLFAADTDGAAMIDDKVRQFRSDFGLRTVVHACAGYLTFARLAAAAAALELRAQFVPSRGPLAWRLKRQVGRVRLGRAPAAFGLWVAR